MAYQVISRKYRPQRFDEIIGQSHICSTLQNAIKTERISHAYLFTGSRGIGKTSTARILAKSLNCQNPKDDNPCNICTNCIEITTGRSIDVLEIDGASNRGIDQIRDLRENVKYPPASSKYRIFIIDEVHMLTKEAFNALLKTLEEPPEQVVFIFATTEPQKIPATIISRCQRYDFHRIPVLEIVGQLKNIDVKESFIVSDDILMLIAKKAEGSMRDAESLLDQIISFSGDTIKLEDAQKILGLIDYEYFIHIGELILNHDKSALLESSQKIFDGGIDIGEFLSGFSEHFRNLLIAKETGSVEMLDLPDNIKERYKSESKKWQSGDLLRLIKMVSDAQVNLKSALNHRTFLEFNLMRMGTMDKTVTVQQILDKLNTTNLSLYENVQQQSKTLELFHKENQKTDDGEIIQPKIVKEQSVSVISKDITIGEVRKKWNKVIQEVGETSPSVANFLKNGLPYTLKGNVIEIAFHEDTDFHRRNINGRADIVENAVESVFNKYFKIKCIVSNENSLAMPDTKELDSITKTIINAFDGEIIIK